MSFVKSGPATLTLAGINSYSGSTVISAGTLALNGSSLDATPSISIAAGATLDVTASGFALGATIPQTLAAGRSSSFGTDINGTLSTSGTVDVAGTGAAGTLTINGDLTLLGGNVLMDLAGTPTVGAGVNDLIQVSGALNLYGPTTIIPNFLTGQLASGTYTLIKAASFNGDPSNLILPLPQGGRQSYTLDTTSAPGSVLLRVAGSNPAALVWSGTNSSTWDAGTVNWRNGTVADRFYSGDFVTLDDTATNGLANVSGSVQPAAVTVNNSSTPYVLAGDGSIDGFGKLTKSGNGTLLVLNSNSYSGVTLISGGTLQVDTNGATGAIGLGRVANNATLVFDRSDVVSLPNAISGTGTVKQIGSGTLVFEGTNSYSGPTIIETGALQIGNGDNFGALGTGPVTDNGALIFDHIGALTLSNTIAGSGVVTNFVGTVLLNGPSAYSGGTFIEGGTVVAANATALGIGNVAIDAGSLYFKFPTGSTNVVANNIALPGVGTQEFLLQGSPTNWTTVRLTGMISGGSSYDVYRLADTGVSGNQYNVIVFDNPRNTFSAWIQMYRGTIGFTSDSALGDPNNQIEMDLNSLNGSLRFDADNLTLNRTITLDSGVQPINVQGFTGTIASGLTGAGTLVKQGSGALILSGNSSYTGPTTISAGTLVVNGSLGSTPSVTVATNAALSGIGSVAAPVTVNGAVMPGTNSVGTLMTGAELWNPLGSMTFTLNSAVNSAGWSLLNVTDGLDVESTSSAPFTIKLVSLTSANAPGLISGFDSSKSQSWTFVTTGAGITNFNASKFRVDTTAFANPLAGNFAVAASGNSLVLVYTPGPMITTPPAVSAVQRQTDGNFGLTLAGAAGSAGATFTVRASTNINLTPLSAWTVIGTGTLGAGPTLFQDLNSTNYPMRFYLISTP